MPAAIGSDMMRDEKLNGRGVLCNLGTIDRPVRGMTRVGVRKQDCMERGT